MTESDLYALFKKVLGDGLTLANFSGVLVRQSYQPRTTGTPTGPTLFLSNMPWHRYGFLQRKDEAAVGVAGTRHTEAQVMETTFQCGASVPPAPPPAALPGYTAMDLCYRASAILQSDAGRTALRVGGVGIERITEIRAPYFKDDRDQFEASPSFDFVVTFTQTDVTESPVITATDFRDFPV